MQDKQTSENLKPLRKYSTPKLVRYGSVGDLTMGGTSRTNDPGGSQNGGKF
jgi:hypothetical protein